MKCFSLLAREDVHLAPGVKVVPAEEFSLLVSGEELLKKVKEEELAYRNQVAIECETYKESAEAAGFTAGLESWNRQLALLEEERQGIRQEMEQAISSLLLTAVKKVIGHELKSAPETITDIIANVLKAATQHKKIKIFVRPADLKLVENERPRLKALFEHLDTFAILPREDVGEGGCIIETEAGIINAQLENQMSALEAAFHVFFQKHKGG